MPQGYETYLQQALSKYRNPDNTKRDVLTAIQHYRGLFPKMDTFVFNDGQSKELLNLDGTIPVPYKGNTYNIPVCVWLLDTHPLHPPICYVKPTVDMQIKVSRHVDQSGKVYLPYLHEWKQNSSDLSGLIQVMIIVFGEQPPVYSKPRQHGTDNSQQQQPPPLPPPPPAPIPHSNPSMTPMYPLTGQPYNMPMPMVSGSQTVPPPPPNASSMSSYPPPYPATTYAPVSNSGYGYQAPGYAGYPPSTNAPSYPPYPTSSGPYAAGYSSQVSQSPMPQPSMSNSVHQNSTTNTITEEHIKASLLSAVEDKLRRRLREVHAQAQAEMDVLKRTQDDLNRGKSKLENMINKLEQEQLELDNNAKVLNDKNKMMVELLAKMETREQIDVDEAVVTVAPLYKQLLNAFAEENAIEDAIYYLGEALRRQVIDLDVFLKHVRELSRKQFMLRALMQKCREKANLPT